MRRARTRTDHSHTVSLVDTLVVPVSTARAATTSAATDSFTRRVLSLVRRIPPGRVSTYGEIAEFAGRPRAGRAVGNIMRDCASGDVPCHRVIAAGGRVGGYGGREHMKRSLLMAEGVTLHGNVVRPFEQFRWKGPRAKPTR